MKVTNKSELMQAAWKMFRNVKNKIETFGEALKMAWTMYKAYLAKQNRPALTEEEKIIQKAFNWAQLNVYNGYIMDADGWKVYYNKNKNNGTIWQVAAAYARKENEVLASFY